MDFIAIDFETTGTRSNMPISLGLVVVEGDEIVKEYYSLIDPKEKIDPYTIRIHGLHDWDVAGQREFPAIWNDVGKYFLKYPVVAHNARFDLGVLEHAAECYGIRLPHITAYDTVEMYRYNYPGLAGYRLNELCEHFGIELDHHHFAGDDAKAAAELMIRLLKDEHANVYGRIRGRSYQRFIIANDALKKPPVYKFPKIAFDEVERIEFLSSVFVITGDFEGFTRRQIEERIASLGGICKNSVSFATKYVLVGYSNMNLVRNPSGKSSKLTNAEDLRSRGADLKILDGTQWAAKIMGKAKAEEDGDFDEK